DGAAAAVVCGAQYRRGQDGPQIVATRSIFYPDSERVMGWDIGDSGFQIVLSAEVPQVVERHLAGDVDAFLASHGLTRSEISSWVCHPGGPRVLEAMQAALGLSRPDLERTWRSLEEVGNLSSVSVLLVLADTLRDGRPPAGSWGMLLALGPGFCSELVLM